LKAVLKTCAGLALLVSALAVTGCGPSSTPVDVPNPPATAAIKQNLQGAVETGQLGSGMMAIDNEIEKLAATDAAKAAELKKEFAAVKSASSPAQVKAKAKEMMDKL